MISLRAGGRELIGMGCARRETGTTSWFNDELFVVEPWWKLVDRICKMATF